MQRSDFYKLANSYKYVLEGAKNSHQNDGVMLSKEEIKAIQRAMHSNKIFGGNQYVHRPNDFISPLVDALASVGFELDTPVNGFQGSYGTGAEAGPEVRFLRLRKKDHNNTDPYTDHPLVSERFQIKVTSTWVGTPNDKYNTSRPLYEIIAYLTA
jgi:hypothetical protein